MQTPNQIRRTLAAAATVIALGALSLSATGCSTATGAAPSSEPVAQIGAPAGAPATQAPTGGGMPGTAPAAAAPASGPTADQGKAIVKASCIGQCHGANLLGYRAPADRAQKIASSMGPRSGLTADKQQAVATFFAQ